MADGLLSRLHPVGLRRRPRAGVDVGVAGLLDSTSPGLPRRNARDAGSGDTAAGTMPA